MPTETNEMTSNQFSTKQKALALGVHVYTATGIVFSILSVVALIKKQFHYVYLWNSVAVIIDGSDGYFARRFRVKEVTPYINGRKLDDIVDFVNYTFVPLILLWQLGILPDPAWVWICFPMLTSLFAFAYEGVKQEGDGFFVGFPSYWNFFVLYADLAFYPLLGKWFVCGSLLVLAVMNVAPLRFVYPSMAKRWKAYFLWGAIVWTVTFLYMLTFYPKIPTWLLWGSFSYPASYMILSVFLDWEDRREKKKAQAAS
jgi:phosphatidylcholine synthase